MNETVDISPQQVDRAALGAVRHWGGPAVGSDVLEKLRHVSTATLATALFKRGLRNQVIQAVQPLAPLAANMVGIAFTLRYIPAREDLNPISVFDDAEHPQRKAIETCPPGAVLVIDSRGNARAASAGSILVRRLMMRGCAGVVTDGGLRDSAEIAALEIPRLPFPALGAHQPDAAPGYRYQFADRLRRCAGFPGRCDRRRC